MPPRLLFSQKFPPSAIRFFVPLPLSSSSSSSSVYILILNGLSVTRIREKRKKKKATFCFPTHFKVICFFYQQHFLSPCNRSNLYVSTKCVAFLKKNKVFRLLVWGESLELVFLDQVSWSLRRRTLRHFVVFLKASLVPLKDSTEIPIKGLRTASLLNWDWGQKKLDSLHIFFYIISRKLLREENKGKMGIGRTWSHLFRQASISFFFGGEGNEGKFRLRKRCVLSVWESFVCVRKKF